MTRVTFWFDFASTYSYPAALRIEPLARAADIALEWKPFLLGPLFIEQAGWKDSPFNIFPQKGAYMWRDMDRVCRALNLPFRKPDIFPQNPLRAARVATVLTANPGHAAHAPSFVKAVYRANFTENRNIADDVVLAEILTKLGIDATLVLDQASTDDTKDKLRQHTEDARKAGLFGAPSFTVGDELFWGNDRLEQAIAFAGDATKRATTSATTDPREQAP